MSEKSGPVIDEVKARINCDSLNLSCSPSPSRVVQRSPPMTPPLGRGNKDGVSVDLCRAQKNERRHCFFTLFPLDKD